MNVFSNETITGGPYDSTSVVGTVNGFPRGNNAVDSAFVASMIDSLITGGVVGDGFSVYAAGGLGVTVSPGVAWGRGRMSRLDSAKRYELVAGYTYSFVVRFAADDNTSRLVVIADSVPFSPLRTESTYDLVIASVRVPAGTETVTSSMITDRRADASFCGSVTSKI